jgi:hypothetical protein
VSIVAAPASIPQKAAASHATVAQSFLATKESGPKLVSKLEEPLVISNVALFIDNWSWGWGGWGSDWHGGGRGEGHGWEIVERRGWHHWDYNWEGGYGFCPPGFVWGYWSAGWFLDVWWNGGWGCYSYGSQCFY